MRTKRNENVLISTFIYFLFEENFSFPMENKVKFECIYIVCVYICIHSVLKKRLLHAIYKAVIYNYSSILTICKVLHISRVINIFI